MPAATFGGSIRCRILLVFRIHVVTIEFIVLCILYFVKGPFSGWQEHLPLSSKSQTFLMPNAAQSLIGKIRLFDPEGGFLPALLSPLCSFSRGACAPFLFPPRTSEKRWQSRRRAAEKGVPCLCRSSTVPRFPAASTLSFVFFF